MDGKHGESFLYIPNRRVQYGRAKPYLDCQALSGLGKLGAKDCKSPKETFAMLVELDRRVREIEDIEGTPPQICGS